MNYIVSCVCENHAENIDIGCNMLAAAELLCIHCRCKNPLALRSVVVKRIFACAKCCAAEMNRSVRYRASNERNLHCAASRDGKLF